MQPSTQREELRPACPTCGLTDSVQSAREIYKAGYIELPKPPVFGLSKNRKLDVRQIPGVSPLNILSAVLAPPVEPVFNGIFFSSKGNSEPKYMRDWPAFVFAAIRYAALALLAGLALNFFLGPATAGWAGRLLFVILLAWLFVRRFQNERRQAEEVRRDHDRWEKDLAAWQGLMYCSRDDSVFLPGNPATARPGEWRSLLNG